MGLFNLLFPDRRNSAGVAKDRLKIVLAHERANRDAPDFLPMLQQELIEVVGRYVEIRGDMLRVNLGQSGETSLLEINVEIDGATVRPPRNGAAVRSRAAIPPRSSTVASFEREGAAPWVKPG
jgi:cell division topological specificity factor